MTPETRSLLTGRAFVSFFVPLCFALFAFAPQASVAQETVAQTADPPPNVVLIIADQMRGDALSTLGGPNARTPNLDRMASEGVLFENYFTNSPVCVPSRMSMFSGRYPHQHGTLTNPGYYPDDTTERLHGKPTRLPSAEGTLLGYFHERGYRLGWFGKDYHTYAPGILDSLLDANETRGREPFRGYTKYVSPYWHGDMYWPNDELHASKTTRDGIEFIGKANSSSSEPFFLTLSYFDPHPPYFAPSEYAAQYAADDMVVPPYVAPDDLNGRLAAYQKALRFDKIKQSDLKAAMKYYYASIEWGVDRQVGRVLQALEEQGLEKNTIVLFTSEHGDFMGDYHMVRKGMFLYDALLHVPLVWYAPGRIEKGRRLEAMAQGVDLFPTLVDMTGGEAPEALPGRSLAPLLRGTADTAQEGRTVFASAAYSELPPDYFEHPEPPPFDPPEDRDTPFHSRINNLTWAPEERAMMARTREWKLILSETRPPQLYRMAGQETEQKNVADNPKYRNVLDSLRAKAKKVWKWSERETGQ